jgi:hypothetical protein
MGGVKTTKWLMLEAGAWGAPVGHWEAKACVTSQTLCYIAFWQLSRPDFRLLADDSFQDTPSRGWAALHMCINVLSNANNLANIQYRSAKSFSLLTYAHLCPLLEHS